MKRAEQTPSVLRKIEALARQLAADLFNAGRAELTLKTTLEAGDRILQIEAHGEGIDIVCRVSRRPPSELTGKELLGVLNYLERVTPHEPTG